ncbi:MAG: hypothetical protein ACRCXT_00835 [Paraclostridium sp.]
MIDIVIVVCFTTAVLVKMYFLHRCEHEYEILKELKVTECNGEIVYFKYVSKCKKCGKIITKSTK